MVRKSRQIINGLSAKGFHKEDRDHIYLHYYTITNKKTTIITKVSRGKKEYDSNLLSQMSKQLKISLNELIDLIDCPLDQNGYEKILKHRNVFF